MKTKAPASSKARNGGPNQRRSAAKARCPEPFSSKPAPIVPKPGTFRFKVLEAIILGKVTQAEVCLPWALTTYIQELGRDGWTIASDWVTCAHCRSPMKRYWADLSDAPTRAAVEAFVDRYLSFPF